MMLLVSRALSKRTGEETQPATREAGGDLNVLIEKFRRGGLEDLLSNGNRTTLVPATELSDHPPANGKEMQRRKSSANHDREQAW